MLRIPFWNHRIVAALISFSALVLLSQSTGMVLVAHAQISGEVVTAKTDSLIYNVGQKIHLTIEDFNVGSKTDISSFKDTYAGIASPCGIGYLDFAFIPGNHSDISNFDQLVALKAQELNVVYAHPNTEYACPDYATGFKHVTLDENSHDAILTFDNAGKIITDSRHLITQQYISNVYGTDTKIKYLSPNQFVAYRDANPLSPGLYTIVAFTMSGKVSAPTVIEITNVNTSSASPSSLQSSSLTSSSDSLPTSPSIISMLPSSSVLIAPLAIGGILLALRLKNHSGAWGGLGSSIAIGAIICTTFSPAMSSNQAFADYSTSSQGVEAHNTSSTFTQATVEHQFYGANFATGSIGSGNGISVQNNQFTSGFTIGTEFLWSQSFIQFELPSGITYTNINCTTQSGSSYNCTMPSQVALKGVVNFWTKQNSFGGCPTTWVAMTDGNCSNIFAGSWYTIPLNSGTTRFDLNAYQQINTDGTIYLDQKYRTCTPGCSSYSTLYDLTSPSAYGQPGNFYYDLGTYHGNTPYYGVEGIEGECSSCDNDFGKATMNSGTYSTQSYTINSSGTPYYRSVPNGAAPSEQNYQLCWYSSISNTGGSNPTFSTSALYNPACNSYPAINIYATEQSTGNPINGLYVTVYDPSGSLIDAGYTPLQVPYTTSGTYTIDFDNYNSYYFTSTPTTTNYDVYNWGGQVKVSATYNADVSVTGVYYNNANPGNYALIQFKAHSTSCNCDPGAYMGEMDSGGHTLSQGFTPYSVGLPAGGGTPPQITVDMDNGGGYTVSSATTNTNQVSFNTYSWGAQQVITMSNTGGGSGYYDQGNYS